MMWQYAKAVFSEYADGVLRVAIERLGDLVDAPSGDGLESVQPLGILSRPLDPTPDGGAGCLAADDGGEGFAMPTTDPRLVAKVPEITKGATVIYSAGPFLLLDQENASTMIYQPVGDDAGQVFSMVGKPGECDIQIRHETGAGIAIQKDGKTVINNAVGDAYIEVGPDGIVQNGNVKINGGVVLGDIAGAMPLAKAAEIIAWAATVETRLTAIALLLNAAGPVTGAPGSVGPTVPLAPTVATVMVSGT